jgi:colicin import membrane protein
MPASVTLDEQIRQMLDRTVHGLRSHLDSELRALVQELTRTAAEERDRAVTQATEAAVTDVRHKAHAQLAQIRDAAQRHIDELTRSADRQINELKRALDTANAQAQLEVEDARRVAQTQVDDVQRVMEQRLGDVQARLHEAERRLDEAQRETDNARGAAAVEIDDARKSAAAQVEHARKAAAAEADAARHAAAAEIDRIKKVVAAEMNEARQAAAAEIDQVRRVAAADVEEARRAAAAEAEELIVSQLAVAAAEHDRRQAEALDQARAAAHALDHEHTKRLVHAIRMLDDARSIGEVLEVLTQGAAREAERVAVLVARGDRLAGWSAVGFGEHLAPPRTLEIDPEHAGLAGTVLRSGAPASRSGTDGADRSVLPPFAIDAGRRDVLALPVIVGGAAVAVLYADALTTDTRGVDRWPSVLDVLARHASRVLEALTVQQAVGLSLPRPMARASHQAVTGLSQDRSVQ